jgi:penicillin-binding protein 1A
VLDEPIRLVLDGGRIWEPGNYGGSYGGVVTMRNALTHSRNVATVRIANEVGVSRVAALAQRLGVAERIPTNPSVVLGTAETTPLRLTAAYATFATLGRRPEPRFVVRVEDRDGRTVFAQPAAVQEVLDPALAFLTTSLLRDVVDRGTGWTVRSVGFRGPAAGKTGTTQDAADAWFVGYTPRLVATVWVGFDRRAQIVRGATGGDLAAPVWGRFMRSVYYGDGIEPQLPVPEPWIMPEQLVPRQIDPVTGKLFNEWCYGSQPYTEYFIPGTEPTEVCDPYRGSGLFGTPLRPSAVDTLPGRPLPPPPPPPR